MAVGNTKKTLVTERVNKTNFWKVVYKGGGKIPAELSGVYTKQSLGDEAINKYLLSNTKVNGKSKAE